MTEPASPVSIFDKLSKWSPLLLLLLGGLLAQLWNRFRTRMRRFTWKAWHTKIAVAANDLHWGNVTVQYNGVPVNHIHVTTVEFNNDSSEDQKDVKVTLTFRDGLGQIIASEGVVQGSHAVIPLDQDYLNLFQGATPDQVQALSKYVVHKIPVFNRRQKATFNLLVVRNDASTPLIEASCVHPGFKTEFLPGGVEIDGVPFNLAVTVGTVATFAVVLLVVRYQRHPHPYLNAIFGWLLGIYVARCGAGVVRAWKNIIRLLG